MNGLLGRKLGMTQLFTGDGDVVPVTVIEAGPCYITQVKTEQHEGYAAVQVGFGDRRERRTTRPLKGHLAKAGVPPRVILREFRVSDSAQYQPGQVFGPDLFAIGDRVDVMGISKGKGFQGVVKRHKFAGGPRTRGQSDRERAPGSIGSSAYPSRVFKGTRMAGRMGNSRVTVKNLTVVGVDRERNLLLIRGAVPGHANGYVMITRA